MTQEKLKELVDKENQPIEEVEKKDLISSRQTKTKSTTTDKWIPVRQFVCMRSVLVLVLDTS